MLQEDNTAAPLLEIAMATEPVENPITLFAPTNEAFAEIAGVVAGLDSELVLAVCPLSSIRSSAPHSE